MHLPQLRLNRRRPRGATRLPPNQVEAQQLDPGSATASSGRLLNAQGVHTHTVFRTQTPLVRWGGCTGRAGVIAGRHGTVPTHWVFGVVCSNALAQSDSKPPFPLQAPHVLS